MDIKELSGLLDKGYSGRRLTEVLTERTDSLLRGIFSKSGSGSGLCLLAVGGYGRGELAPHSDIDIMLFARDRAVSKEASDFLYRLWDTKLTVGHSFRTPSDCVSEAKKDVKTRTSMLEHRLISGDETLYRFFMDNVYPEIAFRESKNFINEKLREVEQRHRKIGYSVFMLEPNIKEGRGMLRDIHTLMWLASVRHRSRTFSELSGLLSPDDFHKLERAYDFLLKVRFCLHLLSGRRNDILSFEFHERTAGLLNFKASKRFLSSERFMRYLYLKASVVDEITSRTLDLFSMPYRNPEEGRESRAAHFFYARKRVSEDFSISRNRIVANGANFVQHPEKIIGAFAVMSKTGKRFSPKLREEIKKNLFRICRKTRISHRAVESFMNVIRGESVYETLREMHACGVLGRFIPEFDALSFLVVYEPHHMFTVDEHSLHAVRKIEQLRDTKYKDLEHLSAVYKRVRQREAIILALLLHDIGKRGIAHSYRYGSGAGHHDEVGYRALKNITERFNLSPELRSEIEFLVKNHLLMSRAAFTLDSEAPEVIARFADEVGDRETLDALYLTTYADMAAVSDGFWSDWKASLLRDFHGSVARYLEGFTKDFEEARESLLNRTVLSAGEKTGTKEFLSLMPERYVISTTPERLTDDYRIYREVTEKGFGFRVREDEGGTCEICIGARDRPGILSRIVGVLSSMKMNIYRARVYTARSGIIVDKIQVSNWKELEWEGILQTMEERLGSAICPRPAGDEYEKLVRNIKVSLGYCLTAPEVFGRFEPFVELDNETSSEHSILEFFARDRLGLLYDATSLMFEKDIDIISARINTESGLAHDIFSVQRSGGKIEDVSASELLLSLWERLK
ncbi:MAG TPA: [protein-PII] uridylyltransferase [Thermodesulfovibrionales bacterium]|nr:[protein-PII] uridylyltransferase [Thermodesulfovibrionales bacterium]